MNKILLGFIGIGFFTFVGCKNDKVNTSSDSGSGSSSDTSRLTESTKIGEQEWMTKNLNVDHFQNGDIIQEAITDKEWIKAGKNEQPAWCYYYNNSSNGAKHGKLYNFYTVNDPRGLAPSGWHVPTDAEWTLLTDYLSANGYKGTEATALKATSGWIDVDNSENGTDAYGWLGLPGGRRNHNGFFDSIGSYGTWWSSSEITTTNNAWDFSLDHGKVIADRSGTYKRLGFSVRCLRD